MKKTYKHAIVLGGSSGIGAELVRQLASSGTKVLAVGRDPLRLAELQDEQPDRIEIATIDLTHFSAAATPTLAELAHRLGGLDLVIYAAGIMPAVKIDEFNGEVDLAMLTTNFLAAVWWLDQAAERFQAVGAGTIVGIGSVAGDRGRRAQPAYNASKAGLHVYMEALRNRLNRHGVCVVTVKPGPVDTPMTAGLGLKGAMPGPDAAKKILNLAAKPGEHYLSITHRIIFGIIRIIPSWIFRRLNL